MALQVAGKGKRVQTGAPGLVVLPLDSNGTTARYCGVFCVPIQGETFAYAYVRPVLPTDTDDTDRENNAFGSTSDVPVFSGTNRPIIFRTTGLTHLAHCGGPMSAYINIIPLEDARLT